MSTETWAEETGPTVPADAPAGPSALGRTTVLPRLERDSVGPRVVHSQEQRYSDVKELGRGGLGVVLGARDRDIGRRVAIKQLRDDCRSSKAVLRFAEEIRTVGKLDHPNIVPIHDVGADREGHPYFVMKYVNGKTLTDIIDALRTGDAAMHARWPFERRMEVFRKVLDAVGFAHDLGIVHRDLKPDNIMVGEHGEVHVLDWGIAHRGQALDLTGLDGDDPIDERVTQTRDGAVMGTPAYMSPEQARGEAVDVRSDIYSLGVLLYEWLTLTHYLAGLDTIDALLEGVQQRPHTPPARVATPGQPAIAPDISWMVLEAVEKDPAHRFQSIQAWHDRIEAIERGECPIQCPLTFQKRVMGEAQRTLNHHPFLWTTALFALIGLGAATFMGALGAAFLAGAILI